MKFSVELLLGVVVLKLISVLVVVRLMICWVFVVLLVNVKVVVVVVDIVLWCSMVVNDFVNCMGFVSGGGVVGVVKV